MTPLTRLCAPTGHASRQLSPAAARAAGLASLALAAGLAACGSVAAPSASPPADHSPGTSPPASTVAACAASALRIRLDGNAAGVAAGSSYVPLDFTNASSKPCTVPSFPAVAFASTAAGPQIGSVAKPEQASQTEEASQTGSLVLAPAGVAHAWLQIVDAANYPAARCKPVQAGGLRVAFAGSGTAAFVAHPFQACANAMPGTAVLAVFAVQAGTAKRGTAP
jgi:hypothetical protein